MGIQTAHHDVFLQPVGMAGCRETKTSKSSDLSWCPAFPFPIGSIYAIYGNIYHEYTPNVSIYTIHGSYGSLGRQIPRLSVTIHPTWFATHGATGRRLWVATLTSIPPRDASHVGTWIEVIGASVTTSGAGAKPVLLAREGIVYWTDALERKFSVFLFIFIFSFNAYLFISSPKCQDEDDEVPNYKIITSIHIYIQSIHMRYGQFFLYYLCKESSFVSGQCTKHCVAIGPPKSNIYKFA